MEATSERSGEDQMSRDELIAVLNECQLGDPQDSHVDADQALLDYIDDPGVSAAFDALTKWYG